MSHDTIIHDAEAISPEAHSPGDPYLFYVFPFTESPDPTSRYGALAICDQVSAHSIYNYNEPYYSKTRETKVPATSIFQSNPGIIPFFTSPNCFTIRLNPATFAENDSRVEQIAAAIPRLQSVPDKYLPFRNHLYLYNYCNWAYNSMRIRRDVTKYFSGQNGELLSIIESIQHADVHWFCTTGSYHFKNIGTVQQNGVMDPDLLNAVTRLGRITFHDGSPHAYRHYKDLFHANGCHLLSRPDENGRSVLVFNPKKAASVKARVIEAQNEEARRCEYGLQDWHDLYHNVRDHLTNIPGLQLDYYSIYTRRGWRRGVTTDQAFRNTLQGICESFEALHMLRRWPAFAVNFRSNADIVAKWRPRLPHLLRIAHQNNQPYSSTTQERLTNIGRHLARALRLSPSRLLARKPKPKPKPKTQSQPKDTQ